jgi:cell division protein FtsB
MKKTGLQRSVAKEKKQIASLGKKIARQEKDMKLVKKEIELERKKQAISISQIPSESTHTGHKRALAACLFPGKSSRMLRGIRKSEEELKVEKRLQAIDAEVDELREKIRNLESEFCRQTIKEDFFRKKLFEYREKVHLLELEKKKIA